MEHGRNESLRVTGESVALKMSLRARRAWQSIFKSEIASSLTLLAMTGGSGIASSLTLLAMTGGSGIASSLTLLAMTNLADAQ